MNTSSALATAPDVDLYEDRGVPLVDILRLLDGEISALVELAHRLQIIVSPLMLGPSAHGVDALHDVQALDLMAQTLAGLSSFLGVLTPDLPSDWRADPSQAAGAITLSGLSKRMAVLSDVAGPTWEAQDDGDFELF